MQIYIANHPLAITELKSGEEKRRGETRNALKVQADIFNTIKY